MPAAPTPAILSIAGSDPSGGAGIQADLKTFTVLGVYGCAAITCLTAQNTKGVDSFEPVPPPFVHKQIQLVLEDIQPSHIKIGMVGNGEIAAAIGKALAGYHGEIFYDPVLKASSGNALFQQKDLDALFDHIISKATVLTPNTFELHELSRHRCDTADDIAHAARILLERFPNLQALVAKGGHFQDQSKMVTDYLFTRAKGSEIATRTASHPRIKTKNSHGTGCTFAAALAAFHLKYNNFHGAFDSAVDFLAQLLTKSVPHRMGGGTGPLQHHLYTRLHIS